MRFLGCFLCVFSFLILPAHAQVRHDPRHEIISLRKPPAGLRQKLTVCASKPISFKVALPDGETGIYRDPPLPPGASLDQQTRVFTWVPSDEDVGQAYQLDFAAEVNGLLTPLQGVSVEVIPPSLSVDLSAYMPPVGNQGDLNSCSSWALGYYTKSFQEGREKNWDMTQAAHQCSPSFLYNQANGGVDEGSYFSDNVWLLTNQGCAPISSMPCTADYTLLPTVQQYLDGMPFRSGSSGVLYNVASTKQHVEGGDVVVVSVDVYSDYLSATGANNVYDGPPVTATLLGSHAITIIGFDDNRSYTNASGQTAYGAFLFINSWGTGYGQGGFGWISYTAFNSYCSYGVTLTDRIGYVPRAYATFTGTHPAPHDVSVRVGVGANPLTPTWDQYLDYNVQGAIDLTDVLQYLPPTPANQWFLGARDFIPSNAGRIDSFSLTILGSPNQHFISSNVPLSIPDAQSASTPGNEVFTYTNEAVVYGDVTLNGSVTAADAALALLNSGLFPRQIRNADVSANQVVTVLDAALIAQQAVGLLSNFPVG